MRRVVAYLCLACLSLTWLPNAALASNGASSATLKGLPSSVEAATVTGYNDGDKFEISLNGQKHEVNLIGADAPELTAGDLGECFAKDAADYVKKLLTKKQTVYLEKDKTDTDSKDRLLRYVWAANSAGDKAYLLNELVISKGYASFKSKDDNTKYDKRLKSAQDSAQKRKIGLWSACSGPHAEITPVPAIGSGDNPAPIGTPLEADGRRITLNSATFYDAYGYFAPAQNRIFLIVNVTMTNISTSGKQHSYNELCFAAKDIDTGSNYDDALLNPSENPLIAGDMNPGETVSGDVTLEVSPNSTNIRVKYSTGDAFCRGGSSLYWLVSR